MAGRDGGLAVELDLTTCYLSAMSTHRRPSLWSVPLVLLLAALPWGAALGADGSLPWIADDYDVARAKAKAEGKPLVIDLWAPWCHTCLSMKHTVLEDPQVVARADRFVWLAMDTDRAVNAPALKRFPPEFWPTFFVVDPTTETVNSRLLGAASLSVFLAFLDEGAAPRSDGPAALAARGDRAAAKGEHGAAATHYAAALAKAPADWARAPAVMVSELAALKRSGQLTQCVTRGRAGLQRATVGHGPAAADFAYFVGACAKAARDAGEKVDGVLEAALAAIEPVLADPKAPLAIDDRSEALRIARTLHEALGDTAGARRRAEAQRALLDEAAAAATDPMVIMTWHWPRAEVHAWLGHPERLIPDLEASVAALPDHYEPPYRLAWIRLKAGDADGARTAALRATERVYGPRAARAWALLADIEKARGDRPAARAALARVVKVVEDLPAHLRRPGQLDGARVALAEFDGEKASPPR